VNQTPLGQPAPVSQVTLLDVYSRQMEISATLAVIHEQLKAVPDHELRIRHLEAGWAKLLGAAVAVSTIVSALGTWLTLMLAHH